MLSTMVRGKLPLASIQAAKSASTLAAKATTAAFRRQPLSARLSQATTA